MPVIHLHKGYNYKRDQRLSWKARGILAYLLDHEEDWEVTVQDVIAQSDSDGRLAVQNALQELVKFHYARLIPARNERGHVQGRKYVIYSAPYDLTDKQVFRLSGNRAVGTDKQVSRRSGNRAVGEQPDAVTSAHRQAGFPTIGKTDDRKTDLITKKDLREDKNQREERDAREVLEYLNEVHGRSLENTEQICTLLKTGVSVEDCHLVIDWLYAVERVENAEGYEKYVNNITPFRPKNFDRYRDRARRWKLQQGQPPTPTHHRLVL